METNQEDNPYAIIDSTLTNKEKLIFTPSEKTRVKIRNAFIVSVITASLTLIVTTLSVSGVINTNYDVFNYVDVALSIGLAFGIYKNSRICAITMLVYYLASRILVMVETSSFGGIIFTILFTYFFILGVAGTIDYHKEKQAALRLKLAENA